MYAVIRNYAGNAEIADQLVARSGEVEEVVSGIQGFQSYLIVRTDDGCATVSVYDDKAGADEATRRAAEWVQAHASEINASAPDVMGGDVVFQAG